MYDILGLKKGFEMNKIIVEFNGWVEADPENIRFQYIGEMAATEALISGKDYLRLDEEERSNYILEDLGKTYMTAFDGLLEQCDVSVEEDPDHVAKEFLQDLLKDKV